jgi:hypothetical protein
MERLALGFCVIAEVEIKVWRCRKPELAIERVGDGHQWRRMKDNFASSVRASSVDALLNEGSSGALGLKSGVDREHSNTGGVGIVELAHCRLGTRHERHSAHQLTVSVFRNVHLAVA